MTTSRRFTNASLSPHHSKSLGRGRTPPLRKQFPRKKRSRVSATPFSLSINPLYAASSSFTQGELEGAKPASNWIKCRAKPCLARRAWSTPRVLASRREATIFVPQGGTKITTLFQAVEKSRRLFRQPERSRVSATPFLSRYLCSQYASFSARYAFSSLMGTRTCSILSRSRTVTQLSPAFSASPTVSKSTVMQNGVPTSSSRR